jgi:hypothetical protein
MRLHARRNFCPVHFAVRRFGRRSDTEEQGGFEYLPHRGAMKRRLFVGSVVAGLLCLKTSAQISQQTEFSGVITGRVLNEKGQPVAKAEVCANPGEIAWIGELPCGRSDSSGAFTIHVWCPAEYVITAVKEKDDYPDTFNTFYGPPAVALPRVTMKEGQTRQEVTVSLGPAYGQLTGKIRDAETGQPIESVIMDLRHANNPAIFIGRSTGYPKGRLRLPLPPVPVIFKISAPGYREWWYGADGSEERAEALLIETGSTRELAITLQPINKDK